MCYCAKHPTVEDSYPPAAVIYRLYQVCEWLGGWVQQVEFSRNFAQLWVEVIRLGVSSQVPLDHLVRWNGPSRTPGC